MPRNSTYNVTQIVLAALMTALVLVTTFFFQVYVPATQGSFNIGESMIYVAALTLGPLVGSFAGGVGASLSDLIAGFLPYAPATLVVKAFEGAVVGMVGKKKPQTISRSYWRGFTLGMGILLAVLLAVIGFSYLNEISLPLGYSVIVPGVFWVALAIVVGASIAVSGFLIEPEVGWLAFSTLIGGLVMIIGYFIYEYFLIYPLFGIQVTALVDVVVNIAQMLIGTIIAVPVVKILQRRLPQLQTGRIR